MLVQNNTDMTRTHKPRLTRPLPCPVDQCCTW